MPRHRGRFAPSPTGPLHFGSLVAATASYLSARRAGGEWLVRIEDLDPPREVPGSAEDIIATLAAFGFAWNESIVRQSLRSSAYGQAVQRLLDERKAFACSCSRTEISAAAPDRLNVEELHYPGWCRDGVRHSDRPQAIRLRVPAGEAGFEDEIQGAQVFDVSDEVGDFVIRRRDGLFSYQLAVVIDDAAQGITHVVRGADLLNSTPRQLLLQRALGLPSPAYAHVPVATDASGVKLSKSAGAAAIDPHRPGQELWRVLAWLRQDPPPGLRLGRVAALWDWAIEHWTPTPLKGVAHACIDRST